MNILRNNRKVIRFIDFVKERYPNSLYGIMAREFITTILYDIMASNIVIYDNHAPKNEITQRLILLCKHIRCYSIDYIFVSNQDLYQLQLELDFLNADDVTVVDIGDWEDVFKRIWFKELQSCIAGDDEEFIICASKNFKQVCIGSY